ncbi:hypothetical protein D3C71_885250 [compost metagenome]
MAYTKDEYYAVKDQAQILSAKLVEKILTNSELLEEIEILRAERSHWYHMYNQECFNEEL